MRVLLHVRAAGGRTVWHLHGAVREGSAVSDGAGDCSLGDARHADERQGTLSAAGSR